MHSCSQGLSDERHYVSQGNWAALKVELRRSRRYGSCCDNIQLTIWQVSFIYSIE